MSTGAQPFRRSRHPKRAKSGRTRVLERKAGTCPCPHAAYVRRSKFMEMERSMLVAYAPDPSAYRIGIPQQPKNRERGMEVH
jgi:hypothetical protein